MTLAISFFDPNVKDIDEGFRGMAEMPGDLFGFESWRGVWGSNEVLVRGGNYLFRLKNEDLYIYPDELDVFNEELESILLQADDIAQKLCVESDQIRFRLQNAIVACKSAKTNGFGLCIS